MSQNQNTNFHGNKSGHARSSRVSVLIDIDTFLDATGNDDEFNLREFFPELDSGFRNDGGEL